MTFAPTAGGSDRYFNNSFSNQNFYPYFRFYCSTGGYHVIGDIEFYGELQL